MKKTAISAILAVLMMSCLSACSACASRDVRKEANENKRKYEPDFTHAVECELGQDYTLTNVQGGLEPYGSIFTVGYTAEHYLTGTLKHDGKKYSATYDFDTGVMTTNAFVNEIIASCIDTLGLDITRVIYCISYEIDGGAGYELTTDIRIIGDILRSGRDFQYFIVTSENTQHLDFSKYTTLCDHIGNLATVHILSTDDFQNQDLFKRDYRHILVLPDKNPTLFYHGADQDVFGIFNLKGYVCIDRDDSGIFITLSSPDSLSPSGSFRQSDTQ